MPSGTLADEVAEECERAILAVMPNNRVGRVGYDGWNELFAYSKSWPCLFPQHGPGRKHEREIALTDWQHRLVTRCPALLLRGLIHSDGCRFINTGRGCAAPVTRSATYRRTFAGASGMRAICSSCGGPRRGTPCTSHARHVARMDAFIGPKA